MDTQARINELNQMIKDEIRSTGIDSKRITDWIMERDELRIPQPPLAASATYEDMLDLLHC